MYNDYMSMYHYNNTPMYNPNDMYNPYEYYRNPYWAVPPMYNPGYTRQPVRLKDYGPEPFVVNIEEATKQNNTFRTALWTGEYLQLTLMSINPWDDIGLERHTDHDQIIRIEEWQGVVKMGDTRDNLDFQRNVYDDYVIFIPAGKWHNLINTGCRPIKLYSIYAPPQHPHGTVHETKRDAN